MNRKTRIPTLVLLGALIALCAASDTEAKKLRYHYIDLGTLGGRTSFSTGINDCGQVVGFSETETGDIRGFLWNRKKMKNLGSLGEDTFSFAWSINDRGEAVGFTVGPDNLRRAVFWDRRGIHELETLGGNEGDAMGINDRGEIVGSSTTSDGTLHAALWDSEGVTDLDPFQTLGSWAWSINRKGEVVGAMFTPDFHFRAVLWSDEGIQELQTLGGNENEAYGINDRGDIVGWSDLAGGSWHACLWGSKGDLLDLGALDGLYSEAFSINNHGQVVGVFYLDAHLEQSRPFLWTKKQGMVDLNTLADLPEGVVLVYALAINDFGWIAAASSAGSACLLIPVETCWAHEDPRHKPHRSKCRGPSLSR